jgi:hemerythrin
MLIWQPERHALGVTAMDTTHQEFLTGVAALTAAGQDTFPALFRALADHTIAHFDNESRLMRECRFPAIAEHEGEHRRILGELGQMARLLERGQLGMVRSYVESLPDWFSRHLVTMDAALAACLRNSQHVAA